jgi:hypothetical protein
MKNRLSTDRARRFCQALAADSEGRRAMPWWTSIHAVAQKLELPYDEAVELADHCAMVGLVAHDQSQHTKAGRRAAELPHSVTLQEAGRRLAKGKKQ